jgi:hypothetical protein
MTLHVGRAGQSIPCVYAAKGAGFLECALRVRPVASSLERSFNG